MMKTVISLAFAAACVAVMPSANAQIIQNELVTNGPQASRGDFGDWSARRNVIESRHYDRLLQTSPGFRHARMRRECGPIPDPRAPAALGLPGELQPVRTVRRLEHGAAPPAHGPGCRLLSLSLRSVEE